jgi:hypothetical protein
MMGRDRRNGRANLKARVGIATAVLVGGGAIGVAAVAATSHGANPAAQSAGYSARYAHYTHYTSEWNQLNSAMNAWSWSRQSTYNTLAGMTQQRTFSQTTAHGKTFAVQRGIVVLATHKFLILQSANGSLHLWLTSGGTKFQNVSSSTSGTAAMTANASATRQAMQSGDMILATDIMAGSPLTASHMLTPSTIPQTVTVQVAGTSLTVTVTITRNTAAVSQTATAPWNGNPWWSPSTTTQNPWATVTNTVNLARGDLALVAGFRSHNLLHAQLVLFSPLTTSVVGGGAPWPSSVQTTTPTVTSTAGASGRHY